MQGSTMNGKRMAALWGWLTRVGFCLLFAGASGCALVLPPTYGPAAAPAAPLTAEEQETVKPWKDVLKDSAHFKVFEAELELLQKEKKHREVAERMDLYLRAYPVTEFSLFEISQRLRYADLIIMYTDSLFELSEVERAGRVLEVARSVLPMNPSLRLQTRKLVRIYRRQLLFGEFHPYFKKMPDPNPTFMTLMQDARQKNTVLPPTHELFEVDQVKLGQWQSAFFEKTYGTALFWDAPFDRAKIPVVLVHGVNGSPKDFAQMVPRFRETAYQVAYFFYPTGMPLGEASKSLGEALKHFVGREKVERLAVVAHSMGGLVTKGVFDQMDVGQEIPAWKVFVSLSSPWTGFEMAEKIENLPDYPPGMLDMAPTSRFLIAVHRTPIPAGIRFYMFFGARGGTASFSDGNDDEVIPLESVLTSPVTDMAVDVYGFYETHMSILQSERVFQRMRILLDTEFGVTKPGPVAVTN